MLLSHCFQTNLQQQEKPDHRPMVKKSRGLSYFRRGAWKRPLPGAPDVSSQLVSSLQFYLCWTLANFFYLTTHFPHPQLILCIKLLENWEGTCWQSVRYTASRIYFTSVNAHPYLTSTYWMIFPPHLQRERFVLTSVTLSEAVEWKKQKLPPHRRLFMLEPTRYFSGSYTVASASDERMLTSSDTQRRRV